MSFEYTFYRFGEKINVGRKKKITTPPGKSVSLADFDKENTTSETESEQNVDDPVESNANTNEGSNEESILNDQENILDITPLDFNEVDASTSEENMGIEGVTNLALHFLNKIEWSLKIFSIFLLGVEPWKIQEGCFYIVKFKSERTKKNISYVGLALEIQDMGTNIVIKYMRKKKTNLLTNKSTFVFPNIDDVAEVDISDIISEVTPECIKRGHYTFHNIICNECL